MKKPSIERYAELIKNQITDQVQDATFYTLIVKHMSFYYLLRQVNMELSSVKWHVHKLMAEINE